MINLNDPLCGPSERRSIEVWLVVAMFDAFVELTDLLCCVCQLGQPSGATVFFRGGRTTRLNKADKNSATTKAMNDD